MGCTHSLVQEEPRKPSGLLGLANSDSDIRVQSVSQYDEEITMEIQRDFWENQQYFLLNNMLMSVQFFENYQKDIVKLIHTSTNRKEKALSRILLQHETVDCISPDIVWESISRNIRYRDSHGPTKGVNDTLAPKRLFVAYDRIEVVDSVEVPQYTSIDKPAYQVRIEKSNRKGFVRLEYVDANKPPKSYTSGKQEPPPRPPEPTPSTSKDPEPEIYEYNTIYEVKTPKPLEVSHQTTGRRDTLPKTCFVTNKVPISQMQFAELKMQSEGDEDEEIRIEDYFDTVVYIDAKGFMDYFKNVIFPNSLGRSLGFNELEIGDAKAIPGKIFCNLTDDDDNPLPCEVIPCVSIPWQEDETYEFLNREDRPTIADTRTGFVYRWPTADMLADMRTMQCVAVPNCFWQKKGRAADATLLWEVAFPRAERYLEARMSHQQLKCYAVLLALLKTYVEPATRQHGLMPEHVRCHMFWECEANYRDWSQHRLGYKIIDVIKKLNGHLSKGELPDYFIRTKNLFANIPKKYLQFAQKQFHIIITAPSMYFLKALKNIRYMSGRFYTPFNFKELHNILTQPQGPKKAFRRHHSFANPVIKPRRYNDRDTQIRHETELKMREQVLRKMKEKQEEENQKNRKDSVDSIDLEWICKNEFERYEARAILCHFIKGYIQIADDSLRLAADGQARLYLKQAFYLSTVLERLSPMFREDASEFKDTIRRLEQVSTKMASRAHQEADVVPPLTPVRNSGQFDFLVSQLKNGTLDLEKLGNSYAEGESKVKFQAAGAQKKGAQRVESGARKTVSFIEPK